MPHSHRLHQCFVFDPEGEAVTSIGHGDRLLHWDVMTLPRLAIQDDLSSNSRILLAAQWCGEALLLAGTLDGCGCPSIKCGESSWQDFRSVEGVTKLSFSQNGNFSSWVRQSRQAVSLEHPLEVVQPMSTLNIYPEMIRLDDEVESLLTVCTTGSKRSVAAHVQLWDVQTGRLIWEIEGRWFPNDWRLLRPGNGTFDSNVAAS